MLGFLGGMLHEDAASGRSECATANLNPGRASCFSEFVAGCSCSPLDQYNGHIARDFAPHVRAFRQRLMVAVLTPPASLSGRVGGRLPGSVAPPLWPDPPPSPVREKQRAWFWPWLPGGARRELRIVLVGRKRSRLWLNEREALVAVQRRVPGAQASLVHFEGMSLRAQMEVSRRADVMVGIDGTGLANANWMRNGSTVIDLIPFGNARARPRLASNFHRMWAALGIRVISSHATRNETVLRPQLHVHRVLPHCRECLLSGRLRGSRKPSGDDPCELRPGQLMWCLDMQDTRVDVERVVQLVERARRERSFRDRF